MCMKTFPIRDTALDRGLVYFDNDANLAALLRKAGATVRTNAATGDLALEVDDQDVLRKCAEHVFRVLAFDQANEPLFLDRPDQPRGFSTLMKRAPDARQSFGSAHRILVPHRTGPDFPGRLGRAIVAKLDGAETDEATISREIAKLHSSRPIGGRFFPAKAV